MQMNLMRRIEKLEATVLADRRPPTEHDRWLACRLENARRRVAAYARGEWPPTEAERKAMFAEPPGDIFDLEDNLAERLIRHRQNLRRQKQLAEGTSGQT